MDMDAVSTRSVARRVPWVLETTVAAVTLAGVMVVLEIRGPQLTSALSGQQFWPLLMAASLLLSAVACAALTAASWSVGWVGRVPLWGAVLGIDVLALSTVPVSDHRVALTVVALVLAVGGLLPVSGRPVRDLLRVGASLVPGLVAFVSVVFADPLERALVASRGQLLSAQVAVVLTTLTAFSLASAFQRRHESFSSLVTRDLSWTRLVALVCAKAALLVALYLHLLGDSFGGEERWGRRVDQPLSWLHAALVAGVIVGFAVRHDRRPLLGRGAVLGLAAFTTLSVVGHLAFLAVSIVVVVSDITVPAAALEPVLNAADLVIEQSQWIQLWTVVALLAVGLVVLVSRRVKTTTGAWSLVVGGIWLVPPLIGIAFAEKFSETTFWATPGQVDLALTVCVAVAVVAARHDPARYRVLARLTVVPFVILTATQVLPENWVGPFWRVAVVVGVAWTLASAAAVPTADDRPRSLLPLSAAQLMLLVCFLIGLSDPTLDDKLSSGALLAWLWLSVPVAALLCARAEVAGSRIR